MKQLITFLMFALILANVFAQEEGASTLQYEKTPLLEQLYADGKWVNEHGTAEEVNANRLAIKAAWQEVNPEVAALYKPVNNQGILPETVENWAINGVWNPSTTSERPHSSPVIVPEWSDDLMIRDDWVDGLEMDVTRDDVIYIAMYENLINFGGTFDSVFIYRSTNGGSSFDLWKMAAVTSPVTQMQAKLVTGTSGTEYMCVFLLTESETFQVWRWELAAGTFQAAVVSGDVTRFGVDFNFPNGTATTRATAIYKKTDNSLNTARSTSGQYGFGWVDEFSFGANIGAGVAGAAYGLNGGTYTVYDGEISGNVYSRTNPNYGDPAEWTTQEVVENGGTYESINPSIVAARKPYLTDEVLIFASQRAAGSTDNFNGYYYKRENNTAYGSRLSYISSGVATSSIAHITGSITRDQTGINRIRTSYVFDSTTGDDFNRSYTYDGGSLIDFSGVADQDVFDGFGASTQETADGMACMAFTGGLGFGRVLYFDANNNITGIDDQLEQLGYSLGQNYPNPVSSYTQIGFHLTEAKDVRVVIIDMLGRVVEELVNDYRSEGDHIINWQPNVSSGTYFYQLQIDGSQLTKKMIVK